MLKSSNHGFACKIYVPVLDPFIYNINVRNQIHWCSFLSLYFLSNSNSQTEKETQPACGVCIPFDKLFVGVDKTILHYLKR